MTTDLIRSTWLNIMNTPTTKRFRHRLIKAVILADNIRIQRGIRILRIRSPRLTIALRLILVISAKKLHKTIPNKRYIGKCGISVPSLSPFTKTIYNIRNSKIGRSNDQA